MGTAVSSVHAGALGGERPRALLTMHHIVSDGWSTAVLTAELRGALRAYRDGRDIAATRIFPLQYADFAACGNVTRLETEIGNRNRILERQAPGCAARLGLAADHVGPVFRRTVARGMRCRARTI